MLEVAVHLISKLQKKTHRICVRFVIIINILDVKLIPKTGIVHQCWCARRFIESVYLLALTRLITCWQTDAVQCSAVQCSAVQCSAVQCSAVQCSAVQYSVVQCSAVQCSAVQFSSVQFSSAQLSSAQLSSVQFSSVNEMESRWRWGC